MPNLGHQGVGYCYSVFMGQVTADVDTSGSVVKAQGDMGRERERKRVELFIHLVGEQMIYILIFAN